MKINLKTELNIWCKKNWIWGQSGGFPAPGFLNEQRRWVKQTKWSSATEKLSRQSLCPSGRRSLHDKKRGRSKCAGNELHIRTKAPNSLTWTISQPPGSIGWTSGQALLLLYGRPLALSGPRPGLQFTTWRQKLTCLVIYHDSRTGPFLSLILMVSPLGDIGKPAPEEHLPLDLQEEMGQEQKIPGDALHKANHKSNSEKI